jgi:hypothetical protein
MAAGRGAGMIAQRRSSGAEVLMAERFDLRFDGAYYGLFVETLELGEHACR